jgi:hypothetical protein
MPPALPGYVERPDAFRNRWRFNHFRFRWSSWILAGLLLVPLGWMALKGALAVVALLAVLPLARDFRRVQCVLCDSEPDRIIVDGKAVTACRHCRVFRAASPPLPL